jgi:hypothetical protein
MDNNVTETTPQDRPFGLVDIVEAFTAMRHEWRTNTKETRQLAELLNQATLQVEAAAKAPSPNTTSPDTTTDDGRDIRIARALATTLAEIDYAIERAVSAARFSQRSESSASNDLPSSNLPSNDPAVAALLDELEASFRGTSWFARWCSRKWHREVVRIVGEQPANRHVENIVGGLELLQTRVTRLLTECDIVRKDVSGAMFDPENMNAVDSMTTDAVPSGHVAEQLKPAYLWRGDRLVCAEVRVAR